MDNYTIYSWGVTNGTIREYAESFIDPSDNYFFARVGNYEHILVFDAEYSNNSVTGSHYIIFHNDPNNNYTNYYFDQKDIEVKVANVDGHYNYSNVGDFGHLNVTDTSTPAILILLCGIVLYHLFEKLMKSVMYRLHRGNNEKGVING